MWARVIDRGNLELRIWERGGCGETLACGTGACAAVAVLARRGRVDAANGVAVSLPGGELRIRHDPRTLRIAMSGPAAFVFEGNMP
jgi:diaminopimelate epimerase